MATSLGAHEDTSMANWSLPTVTDLYTDIIDFFRQRDEDCATMFDVGFPINMPTGAVKWNSANNYFEKYDGATWGLLSTKYIIDVDKLDGEHGSFYQDAGNLNAGTLPSARFNDTSHGNRGNNLLHSVATNTVNGFMPAADKSFINDIDATATELNKMDGNTSASPTNLVDADRFVCNDNSAMKQVALSDLKAYFLGLVYPVGAIYTSTKNVSPQSLFGGSWTAMRTGRVLISESASYTAGSQSGSVNATLVSHSHGGNTGSAGSHNHIQGYASEPGKLPTYNISGVTNALRVQLSSGTAGNPYTSSHNGHQHSITSEGASATNANMQPYLAVYMWERVS